MKKIPVAEYQYIAGGEADLVSAMAVCLNREPSASSSFKEQSAACQDAHNLLEQKILQVQERRIALALGQLHFWMEKIRTGKAFGTAFSDTFDMIELP